MVGYTILIWYKKIFWLLSMKEFWKLINFFSKLSTWVGCLVFWLTVYILFPRLFCVIASIVETCIDNWWHLSHNSTTLLHNQSICQWLYGGLSNKNFIRVHRSANNKNATVRRPCLCILSGIFLQFCLAFRYGNFITGVPWEGAWEWKKPHCIFMFFFQNVCVYK